MSVVAVMTSTVLVQGPVFYHLQRQPFVRAFGDCLTDTECTIQYLHMYKTGGTYLESALATMTNDWRTKKSCCGELVIERFLESPQSYCNAPFASYQVTPDNFRDVILKTCKETSTKKTVVLVTYREPVAWTVSYIHQLCNKNWHKRSERIREMCKRCNYYDDSKEYDNIIRERFLQLAQGILFNATFITSRKNRALNRLALDNVDLDSFLKDLQNYLPPEYRHRLSLAKTIDNNLEKKQLCDFKVPSTLIKALKSSLRLYRNLTLGLSGL